MRWRHPGFFRTAAFLEPQVRLGALSEAAEQGYLPVGQSLRDHLGDPGKPVWHGFSCGHIDTPLTLPLNGRARLAATAGSLSVLEPAVAARTP